MRSTLVASALEARIHVRPAVAHHVRVVMRAQALVAAEAHGHRLVPAAHRDEVQVHVDEEVGLGGAAIELDHFAVIGRAEELHPLRVLGVVVVEAVRPVRVEDAVAHDVADLLGGHAPVDRRGDDDLDVLDPVVGEELEDDGEHALARVGPAHRRQRHRDVVDRDDDLHPRAQLRVQRIAAEGVVDARSGSPRPTSLSGVDRRPRIDDARADGQVDLEDAVAAEDGARCAPLLDRDDERMVAPRRARARGQRRGGRLGAGVRWPSDPGHAATGAPAARPSTATRARTGRSWEALQHAGLHGATLAEVDDRPVVGQGKLGQPDVGVDRARRGRPPRASEHPSSCRSRRSSRRGPCRARGPIRERAAPSRARRRPGAGACPSRSRP